MPETIEAPPSTTDTPPAGAPTPPPGEPLTTPLAGIFERLRQSDMPSPESAPQPEPTPEPTATKPDVTPAPTKTTDFELPPEITGAQPISTDDKPVKVADLIPEAGPDWAKTPKQKEDIQKWRANQTRLEQSVERLEGELKKRPEANVDAEARIQALEQRNLEMSNVIEELGITHHPAFIDKFLKPKAQAIEGATQLLKDLEMDPKILHRALESTGKARIDALDELAESIPSQTVRIKVLEAISQIEQLDKEQKAAEADRENWRQHEDQRIRAQRHQEAQVELTQIRGMIDAAVEGLRDQAGFTILKKIDGNDKWNTHVDGIVDRAKKTMTETTNSMELAAKAVLGEVAPIIWAAYQSSERRRIATEKELAEERGAKPGLGGNGAGAGAGDIPVETGPIADIFRRVRNAE